MDIQKVLASPTLKEWLAPALLTRQKITSLRSSFRKNKPFPHLAIAHFLQEDKYKLLLQEVRQESFSSKESDLFSFFQTRDLVSTKRKFLRRFHAFLASEEFTTFVTYMTKTRLQKNKIDLSATYYTDAHFLLPHDDRLAGRKVAFMYYLTTVAKKEGGTLALYASQRNKPVAVTRRIFPKANTFVCFLVSERSFHAVEEVITTADRITLGGWFHA